MTVRRAPTRLLAAAVFAFVGSFLLSAGPLRATAIIGCVTSVVPPVQLATISNGGAVTPGATTNSQFRVASGSVTTLSIATYHYLPPMGLPSTGRVGLRGADGRVYGPWQTIGSLGSNGVPNAIWTATVDVVLPAGEYTVTDSDPSTWSVNSSTGGAGMFWMTGYLDGAEVLPVPVQLYTVSNGDYATPGVTSASQFTVDWGPVRLLSLKTYHYVAPGGLASAGQIGLRSSDGKVYGPWQATGSPGVGGVANAFWTASIDIVLPAGTYTVTDSDPTTWSANAGTHGAGMFWVTGYQK